jgi:hypothetical protein
MSHTMAVGGGFFSRAGRAMIEDDEGNRINTHGISFDRTVSLGHVLTIMSILAATIGGYVTYRLTIAEHEARLVSLETQMRTQGAAYTELQVMMWNIRQDVAVIRDRLERQQK